MSQGFRLVNPSGVEVPIEVLEVRNEVDRACVLVIGRVAYTDIRESGWSSGEVPECFGLPEMP